MDQLGAQNDRLAIATSVNAYIAEYVRFADAKAAAILTALGSLSVAVAATIGELLRAVKVSGALAHVLAVILLIVLTFAVAFSIIFAVRVLRPNTGANPRATLLTSFPDIAELTAQQYVDQFASASADMLQEHLVRHSKMMADLAMNKYRDVGLAVKALNVTLFMSFFLVAIYLFVRIGAW